MLECNIFMQECDICKNVASVSKDIGLHYVKLTSVCNIATSGCKHVTYVCRNVTCLFNECDISLYVNSIFL